MARGAPTFSRPMASAFSCAIASTGYKAIRRSTRSWDEPFLPVEDRQPETELEPEPEPGTEVNLDPGKGDGVVAIKLKVGPEAETEVEKDGGTESEPMQEASVYDEELEDLPEVERKGKAKESVPEQGQESGTDTEKIGSPASHVHKVSEKKDVTSDDISAAAAGLGFFEAEAVDVSADRDEVTAGKDGAGTEETDVSMEEAEAGGSGPSGASDETGQVLDISDKAGLADAAERERDPGLKSALLQFAGAADSGVVGGGRSGSRADVSRARGRVGGPVRRGSRGAGGIVGGSGKRGGAGGRPARGAQKTGFSWANLGRNKEYCRCLELSAGVDEHERTTYSALESVKKFLEQKLTAAGAELSSTPEEAPGNGAEAAHEA